MTDNEIKSALTGRTIEAVDADQSEFGITIWLDDLTRVSIYPTDGNQQGPILAYTIFDGVPLEPVKAGTSWSG